MRLEDYEPEHEASALPNVPCVECGTIVLRFKGGGPAYCGAHMALLDRDPRYVIPEAINAAEKDLDQPASELVTWCLPELHAHLGYLLPGTVTYGCAFPKNGKTAVISENIAHWIKSGFRPWVMPTESRPKGLITRIACARLGLSVNDVMSRRLRARADSGDVEAQHQLLDLKDMFLEMTIEHHRDGAQVAIEPALRLSRKIFHASCKAAAVGGHRIVVVDHIDVVGGDPETGESGYAASEAVQYDALEFAEHFNIAVLLMTQLNTSRVHNDPLYRYRRPITDWLWMKGVKDHIAASMFGIYRPMRTDIDDKMMAAIRSGEVESWRVALPNSMGIADMLQRYGGERPDSTLILHFEDGKMSAKPVQDQRGFDADRHGISTNDHDYYSTRPF